MIFSRKDAKHKLFLSVLRRLVPIGTSSNLNFRVLVFLFYFASENSFFKKGIGRRFVSYALSFFIFCLNLFQMSNIYLWIKDCAALWKSLEGTAN